MKPNVGELLHGVAEGLRSAVLPALPPGAASRQLKAALVLLGRLERSWDRWGDYFATDLDDMRASLAVIDRVLHDRSSEASEAGIHPPDQAEALDCAIDGPSDPETVHLQLRQRVIDLERSVRTDPRLAEASRARALRLFANLHCRMLVRELHALGLDGGGDTPSADAGDR